MCCFKITCSSYNIDYYYTEFIPFVLAFGTLMTLQIKIRNENMNTDVFTDKDEK